MSSLVASFHAAIATPSLLAFHGEQLTHRPRKDETRDVPVTGILIEKEPERSTSASDVLLRKATLQVAASVTVSVEDHWLRGNEVWRTVSIGEIDGGLQTIELQLHQDIRFGKGQKEIL